MKAGAAMINSTKRQMQVLDTKARSPVAESLEKGLLERIVGQERAVRSVLSLYQVFRAGLTSPNRPLGILLFLGPTGSGKTRVVEAAAETLFGSRNAMIKIDCGEFQHSHEIAKLIGSPPGYLGHRETPPLLAQECLDKYHTARDPFTLVLFDEIEKASDALWYLLLGILDKSTLTLGDNRRVDLSQTMIFMTSNLGAKEMIKLVNCSLGFSPGRDQGMSQEELDNKVYRTALEAARRKFPPEFMNRIDKVVVFRYLQDHHLRQILDYELRDSQRRVYESQGAHFIFTLTEAAKQFLLNECTDQQYGARDLKRAVERFLVYPLANLISTQQARTGDMMVVDFDDEKRKLAFFKDESLEAKAQAALEIAQAVQAKGSDTAIAA
jgi:ATP-dependent Clp protease ATP-binding subunit ClpB